jgi:hypothetical protein
MAAFSKPIKFIKNIASECEKEIYLNSNQNLYKYKKKMNFIVEILMEKSSNIALILSRIIKKVLTPKQIVNMTHENLKSLMTLEMSASSSRKRFSKLKTENENTHNASVQTSNATQLSTTASSSSFECLVIFFNSILKDFHLYKENVERQILKYKLRKMEALYSLSDEERLRIRDLFLEKFPELVVFVLLESQKFASLGEEFLKKTAHCY